MTKKRDFRIHILGSSAATPTSLRHTTAQLVRYYNTYMLLDCAEGTQMQLRRMKLPIMRINHIFISHLHGDHYLGLPGLLFSLHLLGRKDDLHVYSPPGLRQIIDLQYQAADLIPSFKVIYHEIHHGEQLLMEDRNLRIDSIAMIHRIPCYGFLISEKQAARNIRKDSIDTWHIPVSQMRHIKSGGDFVTDDGQVIPNEMITHTPDKLRRYAFCSDTAYTESFLHQIQSVDVLYHEATFLKDKADIARKKMHATTADAATTALKAGAGHLLVGHYSARYKDLSMFVHETRDIFPNTTLVEEGDTIDIN